MRLTQSHNQTSEFHLTQIGFAVRTTSHGLKFQTGRKRKTIPNNQNAMVTPASSGDQKTIQLVNGLAVVKMQLMDAHRVLRWNIKAQNGQMKRLRNTFMISQDDLIRINHYLEKWKFMVNFVEYSEKLKTMNRNFQKKSKSNCSRKL